MSDTSVVPTSAAPSGSGALPAIPDEFKGFGMEDYNPDTDMVMPTMDIVQTEGAFLDNLSSQKFPGNPGIEVVVLGVVYGRTLWPSVVGEDKSPPLCQSYDFEIGNPDPQKFPWQASRFAFADYQADPAPKLPCESCSLKDWGSHPNPENRAPWCAEQHHYVVLVKLDNGIWSPTVLTLQRANIAASKAYLTSFFREQMPMFTCTTRMTLEVQKRGTVVYSTITLTRGTPTDPAQRNEYAATYRRFREFLRTPRRRRQETTQPQGAVQPNAAPVPNTPPVQQQQVVDVQPVAAPVAPAPAPAPAPVAEPIQQPVAAPPAQPIVAPVAEPVAPASAPVADPVPAPVQAAPVAEPAPAPPAAAPAPVLVPQGPKDDDLPF